MIVAHPWPRLLAAEAALRLADGLLVVARCFRHHRPIMFAVLALGDLPAGVARRLLAV